MCTASAVRATTVYTPPREWAARARMIIKTERRAGTERRRPRSLRARAPRRDRRTMCWEVENCDLTIRYRCPAFILRRPCWELWAVEGIGPARACCYNDKECEPGAASSRRSATPERPSRWRSTSAGGASRWATRSRADTTARTSTSRTARRAGSRSRRRSCAHAHEAGGHGGPMRAPRWRAPRLGYVNDLCLTGQFNDCVFYEDAAD